MIYQQTTLLLKKRKNLLSKSITRKFSAIKLRFILKIITFTQHLKQLGINLIRTSSNSSTNLLQKKYIYIFCNSIQFINQRSKSYNFILVIIDQLTKILYFKPVQKKMTIFILAEVILNIIIYHQNLSNSIINNYSSIFIFKF